METTLVTIQGLGFGLGLRASRVIGFIGLSVSRV